MADEGHHESKAGDNRRRAGPIRKARISKLRRHQRDPNGERDVQKAFPRLHSWNGTGLLTAFAGATALILG